MGNYQPLDTLYRSCVQLENIHPATIFFLNIVILTKCNDLAVWSEFSGVGKSGLEFAQRN